VQQGLNACNDGLDVALDVCGSIFSPIIRNFNLFSEPLVRHVDLFDHGLKDSRADLVGLDALPLDFVGICHRFIGLFQGNRYLDCVSSTLIIAGKVLLCQPDKDKHQQTCDDPTIASLTEFGEPS